MPHFKNAQWQVTDYGLETVEGAAPMHYEIEGSQLLEIGEHRRPVVYDWPLHMAEKTWVKTQLFLEAFEKALEFHSAKLGRSVDKELLAVSFVEAHRESVEH